MYFGLREGGAVVDGIVTELGGIDERYFLGEGGWLEGVVLLVLVAALVVVDKVFGVRRSAQSSYFGHGHGILSILFGTLNLREGGEPSTGGVEGVVLLDLARDYVVTRLFIHKTYYNLDQLTQSTHPLTQSTISDTRVISTKSD